MNVLETIKAAPSNVAIDRALGKVAWGMNPKSRRARKIAKAVRRRRQELEYVRPV